MSRPKTRHGPYACRLNPGVAEWFEGECTRRSLTPAELIERWVVERFEAVREIPGSNPDADMAMIALSRQQVQPRDIPRAKPPVDRDEVEPNWKGPRR